MAVIDLGERELQSCEEYMNVDAYRDMCRSGRRIFFKNSPLILIFLCSEKQAKGMAVQGVQ